LADDLAVPEGMDFKSMTPWRHPMWKKDEMQAPAPATPRPEEKTPRPESPKAATSTGERAIIGPSITIRGDVSGDEDLLIQGRVDGSVDLKLQSVTVGREGRVKANITSRVIIVEGEVEGDLRAEEQIILRSTAKVQGDITASRVVLEDGASFRGGVEMGDSSERGRRGGSSSPAQPKKAPEPPKVSSEPGKALQGEGKDTPATVDKAAT
jgi:cytoskeletal protein CcmA (bactofilin family)